VRKGYLDAEYAPVAEKAVRAITANVSADGELQQVSFGTGMGSDLDFYRQIPRTSMPYGQAMAILCLAVYLHTYY
jgi:unsaturated rhamnogalacturonyl hydrolase